MVDDYTETFPDSAGDFTYELTTVVTACTKLMQDQARQKGSIERSGNEGPPLVRESLAADIAAGRGTVNFLSECGSW